MWEIEREEIVMRSCLRRVARVVAALAIVSVAACHPRVRPGGGCPASLGCRHQRLVRLRSRRLLASRIKQYRGVAVRVSRPVARRPPGGRGSRETRTPSHFWVRLIRDAEVIVVCSSPSRSRTPGHPWKGGDCMNDGAGRPPTDREPGRSTSRNLKAIYKQIFEIRKNKPVILRTANWAVGSSGAGQ
jgi:hypothetical protein